jgi:adenylate cyclase class 2
MSTAGSCREETMKHIEVEVKYSLPDPESLIRRLADLDAVPLGQDRQVDTYFNAPHRDFLAGEIVSEWLRLRTETSDRTAERSSINFKRWLPLGAAEATHADEFESGITDREAVRKLLDALGYTEIITVDKIRRQWRLSDVIVAMDTVASLGSFIEVEYAGDAQTVDEAADAVHAAVSEIDVKLGDRDRRGYPYMLLNR